MITIYRKHKLNSLHFPSVAIIDLHVLLFNINIRVNFQQFFILWQRSNYIKRFSDLIPLICLDHLHKLISPLSIEFVRMELRLHYICMPMYCDIFASGLFTETTKMFELNWFNVAITRLDLRLGLRWLPTVSWKVGEMQIFAFSNCPHGYFKK